MCIRDSLWYVHGADQAGKSRFDGAVEPVSYTHLDVYKRQGKGTLFVAKQFRLQQMLRNRGTVDFDHWEAFSLAVLMNNSGNNFLSNTGFAIDHDVGGIAGNFKRLAQSCLLYTSRCV